MMKIVFIGYDKKCLSIIKMSIPNIKISLIPFNLESILFIKKTNPDIVLLDLDLQNDKWPQLIKQVQNMNKSPLILVTGECDNSEKIIKAIKMGVFDYIPKPFTPGNLFQLEKAIKISAVSALGNIDRNSREKNLNLLDNIVGCSKQIQIVKEQMLSYAISEAAILLLGESGVGKNLIAKTIHKFSKRSSSIFRTKHTAGIPPSLFESELYGTNEGAFTDAKSRPGCFESANKGTLFLDEIGEIPPSSQVKLLRILEENMITRLGSNKLIPIDVRVISATNIDIVKAVKNELFRKDLYYRINTLTINIPPLRERKEDIPLLVEYFLKRSDGGFSITVSGLEKLIDHAWPGNIRELKGTLIRSEIHAGESAEINENHINFYEQ